MDARAAFLRTVTGSVRLDIVQHLEPDGACSGGDPKQGLDVFGHTRMRGLLIVGPIYLAITSVAAWNERSIVPWVFVAIASLVVGGLGAATASIDATLRLNTLYAITDRQVLVLGWQWRHGRRTFRLPLADMRYYRR